MDETLPNKRRKISITEEDICTLLQRYSATQLLALLREVSQSRGLKIDWSEIAKKKSIGIINARECQMLWRHLAYGHLINDKIEPKDIPLDDDSDLDTEVEASPPVSADVLTEAVNCVKALSAGSPEPLVPNNSTAEIDLANGQSSHVSSEHSHPSLLHTSVPPSIQKPTQLTGKSGEGLDGNGSNYPCPRKKSRWTKEEDLLLVNAVKKHGEGFWATIVKSEFNGNRTASQLSQRWALLKKKQGSVNTTVNAPQFSEQHLATRHALEHALKNPVATTSVTGAAGTSQSTNVKVSNKDTCVTNDIIQSQQVAQVSNTSAKPVLTATTSTHPLPRKTPSVTTNSLQATAVAVGARVSRLSDSQPLVRVSQTKNALHIRGSTTVSKSSLPPNVHFICTGLSSPPARAAARAVAMGSVVKPSVPIVNGSKLERSNTTPSSDNELLKTENKISGEVKVPSLNAKLVMGVSVPSEKGRLTSPSAVAEVGKQTGCAEALISKGGNEKSVTQKSANSSTNETCEVLRGAPSLVVGRSVEDKKPSSEALEGTGK